MKSAWENAKGNQFVLILQPCFREKHSYPNKTFQRYIVNSFIVSVGITAMMHLLKEIFEICTRKC